MWTQQEISNTPGWFYELGVKLGLYLIRLTSSFQIKNVIEQLLMNIRLY